MLGIPKTIPSLLSGEMRDTAILGQLESVLGLGQNPLGGLVAGTLGTVATTFRTWGSLWAMLPRGGVDIWGADDALGAPDDVTRAPDETSAAEVFFRANETEEARDEKSARHFRAVRASPLRHFLSVREETEDEAAWDRDRDRDPDPNDGANDAGRVSEEARVEKLSEKLSVTASARLLFDRVGAEHPTNLREYRDVILGSDGVDAAKTKKNMSSATRFGDPLVSPLPRAPGLQIFCAYGVGKPTERAYHYVRRSGPASAERPYALDVKATRNAEDVDKGVALTDGDGSIPLVSLGYVCAEAWRARGAKFGKKNASDAFVTRLNPGGAVVKIREYPHRALGVWNGGLQEGPGSGDHVNIMGNHEMIRDVVEAVTGHGGEIEERVHSGVFELAGNVERLREAREKKSQTRPEPGGGRDEL